MADLTPDLESDSLTVFDALRELREAIERLQRDNLDRSRGAMFTITEGELELKLVARRALTGSAKGHAGWRLLVADAGVEGQRSREQIQTLKIKFQGLQPLSPATAGSRTIQGTGSGPTPAEEAATRVQLGPVPPVFIPSPDKAVGSVAEYVKAMIEGAVASGSAAKPTRAAVDDQGAPGCSAQDSGLER